MTRSSDKTSGRRGGEGSSGGRRPPMRQSATKGPPRGKASAAAPVRTSSMPGERIAKAMARAGLCSRRDAEAWIAEGRVAINGRVIESPAINVVPDDKVTVDGKPLAARERTRLFLFHKPRGTVTTDRDPEGRPTIFDVLPKDLPRLITIGRLDINTEGLLLLTNDGGLARVLELPSTGWVRRYRVRAHGEIDQPTLDKLKRGVTVEGIEYAPIEAVLDRQQGSNVWLTMALREGKNREVKRVLEYLGLDVNRLIRISFGPFQLGELPERAVEEVRPRILKDQLGHKLAQEAGADFDSPLLDRSSAPAEREEPRRMPRARRAGAEEERPVREKPRAPGPRKHVSTLRALRAEEDETGARRRTERHETEDRHGRAVVVERKVKAAAPPEARSSRSEKWRGKARVEEGFAAGRGRPPRDDASERGGWKDKRPRAPAADESAGERKPWERREQSGDTAERPRRAQGDKPRFGKPRFDAPSGERPPRVRADGERAGRPKRERPASGRSFGDGPRPERRDGERTFRDGPRRERQDGERGKSFGGKSGSGRPAGGRPGGKSFGGKPGGKPAGGRPSGGRPSGGKPGGRPPRGRG